MLLPPKTGNQELDSFLEQLSSYILSLPAQPYYNRGSGEVKSLDTKQTLSYLYRYLHVKFADNTIGLNFSDNPAGRSYYGFSNSESSTAPVDYASYSWYPLPTGQVFGTDNLYYRNLGSRTIDTAIQSAAPNHTWSLYSNTIDLDKLILANSISSDEIGAGAVTEIKLADNSVTTNKINNGAVSLSKLATTGTPSSSTFLAGNMQWVPIYASIPVACSDEVTSLTTGSKVKFRAPFSILLSEVKASINSPQTSGDILTIDMKVDGSSVFGTLLSIDNDETSSVTATTPATILTTSIPNDSLIEIEITQVGSPTAANGLKLYINGFKV